MSMLKSIIIGAVAALVVVAVAVALIVAKVVPVESASSSAVDGPVVVALVLPDNSGIATVRIVDIYTRSGAGWTIRSVSPSMPVVVSGTGGSTLADAYSFGGGAGLMSALRRESGSNVTAWVIVGEQAWNGLRAGAPFDVMLNSGIEVFDGAQLYSFSTGTSSVSPTETPQLLDGAAYLSAAEDRAVRVDVGNALGSSLASATAGEAMLLESNLNSSSLHQWLSSVHSARRTSGK
jgi:hypothetical protein